MRSNPNASIIIPVVNNLAITEQCLMSVYAHTVGIEVIVVDNGSTEPVKHMAEGWGAIVIRNEENLGFAAAINQGIQAAKGTYLVLLNNDTIVTPRWLRYLLAHFDSNPSLGLIGPRTDVASGPQQIAVDYFGEDDAYLNQFADLMHRTNEGLHVPCTRIIGMCMVVPRKVQEEAGLFDERFGIGNYEDDDYCIRVRQAGYTVAIALDVFIRHLGSATFNALGIVGGRFRELLKENEAEFVEKWGKSPREMHESCMNP